MNEPTPPARSATRAAWFVGVAGLGLFVGLLVGAAHGVRMSAAEADELMHGGGEGATVLLLFGLPMFAIFVALGAAVGAGLGLALGLVVEAIAGSLPRRRTEARVVLGVVVVLLGLLTFVFPETIDRVFGDEPSPAAIDDVPLQEPWRPTPPVDAGPLAPSILAVARLDQGVLAIDRHGSRVVPIEVSGVSGGPVSGVWWSSSRARAVTLVTRDDASSLVLLAADGSAEEALPGLPDALGSATCRWIEVRSELVCLVPEGDDRRHAELVTVPLDGRPMRRTSWRRAAPTGLPAITLDGTGVLYVDACDDTYCVERLDATGRGAPHVVATIERMPTVLALGPRDEIVMATNSDAQECCESAVWYVEPPYSAGAIRSAHRLVTLERYDRQPYSVRSLAITPEGASVLATTVVGPASCAHDCDPTLQTIGPLSDPLYSAWTMNELDPQMWLVAIP